MQDQVLYYRAMSQLAAPKPSECRERSESSRLDNFVDGAFAFAITLLVALLALTLPGRLSGIAGAAYFLLVLIGPIAKYYRKYLEAKLP
jgi:hypothetical protein